CSRKGQPNPLPRRKYKNRIPREARSTVPYLSLIIRLVIKEMMSFYQAILAVERSVLSLRRMAGAGLDSWLVSSTSKMEGLPASWCPKVKSFTRCRKSLANPGFYRLRILEVKRFRSKGVLDLGARARQPSTAREIVA